MEPRQQRRKRLVPLYSDALLDDPDEDFEPSSQPILSGNNPKSVASKPAAAGDAAPGVATTNAFAQYRLDKGKDTSSSSKSKSKVNPVRALEQQLSGTLPEIAAPAQIASTLKQKRAKIMSLASAVDDAAPPATTTKSRAKPRPPKPSKTDEIVDLTSPVVEKKSRPRAVTVERPRPEEPPAVAQPTTEVADDEILIEESNNEIAQVESPRPEPEVALPPPSSPVEPAASPPQSKLAPQSQHKQLEESPSPGLDYCMVCRKSLANLDDLARTYHVNRCLDGKSDALDDVAPPNDLMDLSRQPDGVFLHVDGRVICSLCSADVTLYNDARRNNHADRCLNRQPLEGDGTMTGKRYACPLCSINLSDRSIEHRVSHIRQCSAKKGISVAEMGKLLAESPLSARMPDLDAPVRVPPPPGSSRAPKNVNEARLQLAMALSASEADAAAPNRDAPSSGGSPVLSDKLPTPSLGLTMDSQLDLAGFRISQHHTKRAPHNVSPNSKSRLMKKSLLAGQIPFEDDESDYSNPSPPSRPAQEVQMPQSALASKYQRRGGSPRKGRLDFWSLQGQDSVDVGAFTLPKQNRVPKSTRVEPPPSQQAPAAASQILPTQSATQVVLTQTGYGAVDALVDLFDQEDALEDRDKVRPEPKKRAREQNEEEALPSLDKGLKRTKTSELYGNDDMLLWSDAHPDEAASPIQPPRLVASGGSNVVIEDSVSEPPSPMDCDQGDLGDSQEERRQSLGGLRNTSSSHIPEEVQQSSVESDLKQIVADTAQKMKRLQSDLATELLRLQSTYFTQVGKLTQEVHADVTECLESRAAELPADRIDFLRSQMFVEIGKLTTSNAPPTLVAKARSSQESLFQWAARQQSPSPPIAEVNTSNDSPKDSAPQMILRKNDMSIIAMGSPSNNSSPEFKTPPPRMAVPRRPRPDSVMVPRQSEVLDLSSSPEDAAPAPASQVLPPVPSRARPEPPVETPPEIPTMDIDDIIPGATYGSHGESPPSPSPGSSTPAYSTLSLAELRAMAAEFGLKTTLTKQQLIDQLQRIWRSKHGATWSPHTVEAAAIQQAGLLNSPSPSPAVQVPVPALYTKNSLPEDELKQRIINAIKQDTALWQLILRFVPLEIEKIQDSIRKTGIKVSKEFLREFLQEKSVVIAKTKRV